MTELNNIAEFGALSLASKFEMFEDGLSQAVSAFSSQDIYNLLRGVILDESENNNIRRKAVQALTNYVLLKKIKVRQALSVLIDDWISGCDVFLEIQRLQDLFYYYSAEETEIEQIYIGCLRSAEAELSAEANFRLGLIRFQNSIETDTVDERVKLLDESVDHFSLSLGEIENRDDAAFFSKVVLIIKKATQNTWDTIYDDVKELSNILFHRETKSFDYKFDFFFISIYRSLNELCEIKSNNPSSWLDFRKQLTDLYSHYFELQNQVLKDRLNQSTLSKVFFNLITEDFIEPYFTLNFQAEMIRIDARINEIDHSSLEGQFLVHLRNTLTDKTFKKKVQSHSLKEEFKRIFPYRSEHAIDETIAKVTDLTDPSSIANAYYDLLKPSLNQFIDSLVQACIYLQGNRNFRGNFSEDDRNTFITNMLSSAGYNAKDQTRWSVSAKGKSAGEIDIYIQDKKNNPYAIIEALNLDSLNQQYLILHLDKLLKYDTAGHEADFILVYSTAKNFGEFWSKYCGFIKSHSYKFIFKDLEELNFYKYANLKVARARHQRENQDVFLYHIVVDLQ